MKVLLATQKPFAAKAVDGIVKILTEAGHEVVKLEKYAEQSDFVAAVADALTEKGYKLLSAQVEMLPQNGTVKLTSEEDIKNMQKLLDMFEDNDDVQNVWHNWEDAE